MAGLFPPDAVIRRVDGESVLLLGGGRALLMQLAHPAVAEGVAGHSDFAADPFGRLRRTLETMNTLVFGSVEEAERTAAALAAVHDRVTGPGWTANDPDLLLWVHATLVDTALRVHRRFLRPLPAGEADQYYRESMTLAEVMGVPLDAQPPDLAAFRDYVRTMVGSLEVTDTARRVAADVLHPRVPMVAEPLVELGRQLTVGLLPDPLRAGYGLRWDRRRQLALEATSAAARGLLPLVPAPVRRAQLVG